MAHSEKREENRTEREREREMERGNKRTKCHVQRYVIEYGWAKHTRYTIHSYKRNVFGLCALFNFFVWSCAVLHGCVNMCCASDNGIYASANGRQFCMGYSEREKREGKLDRRACSLFFFLIQSCVFVFIVCQCVVWPCVHLQCLADIEFVKFSVVAYSYMICRIIPFISLFFNRALPCTVIEN